MVNEHSRRAGSVASIVIALLLAGGGLLAASLETELEEDRIAVGDSTTLRVRIQGGAGEMRPVGNPNVPGLDIGYGGVQQRYEFINGRSRSSVELLYTVTALREGRYTIPPIAFTLKGTRLESRAVTLTVVRGAAAVPGGRQTARVDVKGSVELTARRVVTGQPLVMRYYLAAAGTAVQLQGFEKLPEAKGFVIKKIDEAAPAPAGEGEYQKSYITSFILIPAGAGGFTVGGGVAAVLVDEPISGFGGFNFPGMTRPRALPFPEERIEVAALPAGAPAGFHGDVGAFTVAAECSRDTVPLYAEKRITVTVKGSGNLLSMTRPECLGCEGLKVIGEDGEAKYEVKGGAVSGEKKFQFTVIPEREGAVENLRFRLVAFNPARGAYEAIESAPVSFTVKGGRKQKGGEGFDSDRDERLDLNPLYLVLIVLIAGGAVAAAVLWERRRYRIIAPPAPDPVEDRPREGAAVADPAAGINRALLTRDAALFLKEAERYLAAIEKDPVYAAWPADRRATVSALKEELYTIKYGGGSVAAAEMTALGDRLLALRSDG